MSTPQPNLIWIISDQHRLQALGTMGDPNLATPNLDRLAAEGFTSTAAVGGSPLCCPYRGSLLTSRYPHHAVPGHEYPLPDGMPTVAAPFNEAGYATAWFGKWHVDGFQERHGRAALHVVPRARRGGFQTWVGYDNNNAKWDCWVHGHTANDDEVALHRLPGFETDSMTDLFLEYLRQPDRKLRPFFATLSVTPPHDPYLAPEEWMRRHTPGGVQLRCNVPDVPRVVAQARRELAGYCAMIENLDWNIGRIRTALAATGLADNTHIVFFSDHGDMLGSHGQFRKTSPLEEAVRVPFIISGFGAYKGHADYRCAVPVNHVDIAPTSLGLCGIPAPGWMAGTDYSGYRLWNKPVVKEPDSAFLQLVVPTGHADSTDRPWRGVVTRDGWKYVCLEGQPWLMFNLNEDPYEFINLAHNSVFHAQRRRLHDRLAAWINDTGDKFQLPEL
ncbi:MAG: sulfatase [Lentisphaeria bacterium]|jgi:arylsulfatase A-like enzyme